MTREEEIRNKAVHEQRVLMESMDWRAGFISGAKWADKTLIEKACEWISQAYTNGVLDWKNCDSIIEDFKKAMKGGAE